MRLIILLILLTPIYSDASTVGTVDKVMFAAPYLLLIGDEDALPKAGAVFAAHTTISMAYNIPLLLGRDEPFNPYTSMSYTSAGAVCAMQPKEQCALALVGAGTMSYLQGTGIELGMIFGLEAGLLIPKLFITF